MKKYAIAFAAFVLAFAGITFTKDIVLAEEAASDAATVGNSIRVQPTGIRLQLEPGEVIQGNSRSCRTSVTDSCSVKIVNEGDKAFKYKVYFGPYTISNGDNNNPQFVEGDKARYTQISRWLTVKNNDGEYVNEATFSIEPKEEQTVEFRITVPEDIPGGSQFGVLWAQILNEETQASGVQTSFQAGTTIIARSTGEANESGEISDMHMTGFALGGKLEAKAKVKNTGNTDFGIQYTYTAKTLFGKEVFTQSENTLAYPEVEYEPTIVWEDPPMLGILHTTYLVSAANDSKTISHIVIIMPLFAIILLILLLTVIVTWIIIIIRKRKERKARKLV